MRTAERTRMDTKPVSPPEPVSPPVTPPAPPERGGREREFGTPPARPASLHTPLAFTVVSALIVLLVGVMLFVNPPPSGTGSQPAVTDLPLGFTFRFWAVGVGVILTGVVVVTLVGQLLFARSLPNDVPPSRPLAK